MSRYQQWVDLGIGYPGEPGDGDRVARAAFDVLAPINEQGFSKGKERSPIYEVGHEYTPTPLDVWAVALKIAEKVREGGRSDAATRVEKMRALRAITECGGLMQLREALDKRDQCVECAAEYLMRTGLAAVMGEAHRYPKWYREHGKTHGVDGVVE